MLFMIISVFLVVFVLEEACIIMN